MKNNDFPVFSGKFLQCFVDFELQFIQMGTAFRVRPVRFIRHVHVLFRMVAVLVVVQTVGHSAVAFFQEVSGVVDGNGVQPCVKGALSIKVAQGPVGFGERFLGDVIGIVVVVRHLVQGSMEFAAVANDKFVKSPRISFPCPGDQFGVFQGRV